MAKKKSPKKAKKSATAKAGRKTAKAKTAKKPAAKKRVPKKKAAEKKAAPKKLMSKEPAVKKPPMRGLAPPQPSSIAFEMTGTEPAHEGDWIESHPTNKHGTLSAKVIRRNPRRVMWMMSAHVAAQTMNSNSPPIDISLRNGAPMIGRVKSSEYFRQALHDVAFIAPNVPLDGTTSVRGIASITPADEGREVIMVGAVTTNFQGKITNWSFEGSVGPESVEDHIGIEPINGSPAPQDGDSGALIIMKSDNRVAGIMRASNHVNFAVATKFSAASSELKFVLAD